MLRAHRASIAATHHVANVALPLQCYNAHDVTTTVHAMQLPRSRCVRCVGWCGGPPPKTHGYPHFVFQKQITQELTNFHINVRKIIHSEIKYLETLIIIHRIYDLMKLFHVPPLIIIYRIHDLMKLFHVPTPELRHFFSQR